jgi:hypothetical protein
MIRAARPAIKPVVGSCASNLPLFPEQNHLILYYDEVIPVISV